MAALGLVKRTWMVKRTIFDHIPVRGLFYFQNGNPTGVFVKISPVWCASPVGCQHLNNPHFEFKAVVPRGVGDRYYVPGDFVWFQGNTTRVPRSAKVIEVNPSEVFTEADKRDW